jgi:hypothetical protein
MSDLIGFTEFELSISTKSMEAAEALRVMRLKVEQLLREIEELKTCDMFWDELNPEHESCSSGDSIADILFERYPDGYSHRIFCAKRFPIKKIKVWEDSDGIDSFINWEFVE